MSKKVVIIDYGMGNIASVEKGFKKLGAETIVTNDKTEIDQAGYLVLPGVGAFGDGMKNLKQLGLVEILSKKVIQDKAPFIGLCLGMQLLADVGHEFGKNEGLGWIKGETVKLERNKNLRLPHVGWNEVKPKKESLLYRDIDENDFYFVHSYHLEVEDDSVVSGVCNYGQAFAASIEKENIFATQFHPEKSQESGLKLLSNFLSYRNDA